MKLPFFNFDDSYPLTLGVADDYFTLSTRLKRLGRAPMQPRRRAAWLLSAALLVSFAAVVPFKLTARAQNERAAAELSGIVRDQNGQAVADATVYLALRNRAEPLETTTTSADGRFTFSSEIENNRRVLVWADAGARGLGLGYISQGNSGARLSNPIIAPRVPVKLLLVAPDGKRAANVRVRVGQMGPEPDEQWIVPRPISQKLQTQTNARGEAVFAGLPAGQIAQFWLSDQKYYPTQVGFGDLRGGQYAPLDISDAVKVGKTKGWKLIRLVAPVTLRGRVTTPAGIGKSGALVIAQNLYSRSAGNFYRVPMTPQARTDAGGNYVMKGLQPDFYRVEVVAEPWLAQSYVSPIEVSELKAPNERVDLALSRGGLIRGVVRQKGTRLPAVGQSVGLFDFKRNYQVTKTNERGAFQFRANAGDALVWTQNGGGDGKLPVQMFSGQFSFEDVETKDYHDTPRGFRAMSTMKAEKFTLAPANSKNDHSAEHDIVIGASQLAFVPVKAGAARDIAMEMPAKALVKTATLKGMVSLPNGKGKDAIVMVRPAADIDYSNAIEKPTDARGRYSITGLKPGRYTIIAGLDDVTKQNWAAPKMKQTIKMGINRADIKLSHGALIEGVVRAKSNHQTIAGVEVLTADADGDGTIEKTKSNGAFRFRVAPGRVAVRLHQNGTPPLGFALTKTEFAFNARDGQHLHTNFELPTGAKVKSVVSQAITGTVVGPDGKPVAGADVGAQVLEFGAKGWNSPLVIDANGRFRVAERSANLFARKGDLTTARGTFALLGDDVTLQMERDVYAQVEGQITNRTTGQPIGGAKVWYNATGQMSYLRQITTMLTDAQGRFHFAKLRPFQPHSFTVSKNGYQRESVGTFVLQKGETKRAPVALRPLSQTLSGRVLLANGQPAGAGFLVLAGTANPRDEGQKAKTRADGSFSFPNVLDEKL